MIVNIGVPVHTVLDYSEVSLKEGLTGYPLVGIDRGSYIVGAQLQSGLNFHMEEMAHNLQIGKYSSCAEAITFMIDLNHDYKSVYMGCIPEFKDLKPLGAAKIKRKGQILIQNDCWIGHGATIMSGTIIHNGAVVAAESVVTKDIPPYAIVGGNPAKVIGYRFPQQTIDMLQKIAWWDWEPRKLKLNYESLQGDVEAFISKHIEEAEKRIEKENMRPNPVENMIENGLIYALEVDIREQYPVCVRVINEFCQRYDDMSAQLVLFISGNEKARQYEMIMKLLQPYEDRDCVLQIIDESDVTMADVIRNSDVYITNRSRSNIYNTCKADFYSKKIISGVDCPIF